MRVRSAGVLGLIWFTGCATMISGRKEHIAINVRPVGTTVCVDGRQVGTSPMVAKLSRRRAHVIMLEHEGHQPVIRALSPEVNPWIVMNFIPFVLFPGPLGLAVDVATGAAKTFNAPDLDFYLEKADATAAPQPARAPCAPR